MNAEAGTEELLLTYRGTVYPWHLDHMEHMNIQHYMAKFDEAVWNLFHRIGLTPSYLRAEHRGMAALETNVRYLKELFAGDVVAVHSGVLRVGETSLYRQHPGCHNPLPCHLARHCPNRQPSRAV